MFDTLSTLQSLNGITKNEYLLRYSNLIDRNRRTKVKPRFTNAHHIIPKAWFKLNGKKVDNSLSNLVNLTYRDHVLAHYYLCLCTEDKFQYANELALMCLLNRKKLNIVDKQLISHLPLYNNIYESYQQKCKMKYRLY